MKRIAMAWLGVVVALTLTLLTEKANAGNDPQVRKSLIVSTGWLAEHLKDDSLVLLQVGEKDEYTAAHIPGAQFIALADISTDRKSVV